MFFHQITFALSPTTIGNKTEESHLVPPVGDRSRTSTLRSIHRQNNNSYETELKYDTETLLRN